MQLLEPQSIVEEIQGIMEKLQIVIDPIRDLNKQWEVVTTLARI